MTEIADLNSQNWILKNWLLGQLFSGVPCISKNDFRAWEHKENSPSQFKIVVYHCFLYPVLSEILLSNKFTVTFVFTRMAKNRNPMRVLVSICLCEQSLEKSPKIRRVLVPSSWPSVPSLMESSLIFIILHLEDYALYYCCIAGWL